jgi:TonB family protein
MLDQLVESKSNSAENSRRSGFLATVFVVMSTVLISGVIYSLFAKDYGMGGSDLELSTLVAPIPVEEEPPPKVEEQKKAVNVDVRKEIILNMMESPKIPPEISIQKNTQIARDPNRKTVVGDKDFNSVIPVSRDYEGPVSNTGDGSDETPTGNIPSPDQPPPPPTPTPKPPPSKPISGGVLNGKATRLPTPTYPPAARAVRAGGSVAVQVLIDENGNVISASAASGNPLLRAAAVAAARGAKFSPTKLSGQPVKVQGIITYNFVP